MIKRQISDCFSKPWRAWRSWREPIRAGEYNRAKDAKDAKDAKVKGKKDEEIVRVVGGGGFAQYTEMDDPGAD
jgi:hypothetical protein